MWREKPERWSPRCGGIPCLYGRGQDPYGAYGLSADQGRPLRHAAAETAGCGFPLRRSQTGGGPGKRHESHQCGGHFPICGRPGHGRGAPDAGMQRSPVRRAARVSMGTVIPGALGPFLDR